MLALVAVLFTSVFARAEDKIVIEPDPEPEENVQTCDIYGKGWVRLPGSQTCTKIDGDVRVQYGVRNRK
jgi:Porin subfamily